MEDEKNIDQTAETLDMQEALPDTGSEPTERPPRPLWQRIGAGICLVLFIALILMYYINIMRGGR